MKKIIIILTLLLNFNCFSNEHRIFESEQQAYRMCLIHNTFQFYKIINNLLKFYKVQSSCNDTNHNCQHNYYQRNTNLYKNLCKQNLSTDEAIKLKDEAFNILMHICNKISQENNINPYKPFLKELENSENNLLRYLNKIHTTMTCLIIQNHLELELHDKNHCLYEMIKSFSFENGNNMRFYCINLVSEFHLLMNSKTKAEPGILFFNELFKYDFDHNYKINRFNNI